jgi:Uma2 family endonuclease
MADAAIRLLDEDELILKRTGVRFPLELRPSGFVADDLSTWPEADGRLELVQGRLLYMPPCADIQQDVAVDLIHALRSWSALHPGFVVGGNEAGMKLGSDVRAADAAVWTRLAAGASIGKLRAAPPVLAAEVAGADEDEAALRDKAAWYLGHGVRVVWIVLPPVREALVLTANGESRHSKGDILPACSELPGLELPVARLFDQLDR